MNVGIIYIQLNIKRKGQVFSVYIYIFFYYQWIWLSYFYVSQVKIKTLNSHEIKYITTVLHIFLYFLHNARSYWILGSIIAIMFYSNIIKVTVSKMLFNKYNAIFLSNRVLYKHKKAVGEESIILSYCSVWYVTRLGYGLTVVIKNQTPYVVGSDEKPSKRQKWSSETFNVTKIVLLWNFW